MGKRWGGAIVIALLLAGCTHREPGTPHAGPTTATTTTVATTTKAQRPRPIDMRAVQPCALLRDLPPADFGLTVTGRATPDTSYVFPGSTNCFDFASNARMGLGITPAVNQGFDAYLDGVRATVTGSEVAGYRFALVRPENPDSCFAVVDVNDGQLLFLSMSAGAVQPAVSQDAMCALLPGIAGAAIRVLAR